MCNCGQRVGTAWARWHPSTSRNEKAPATAVTAPASISAIRSFDGRRATYASRLSGAACCTTKGHGHEENRSRLPHHLHPVGANSWRLEHGGTDVYKEIWKHVTKALSRAGLVSSSRSLRDFSCDERLAHRCCTDHYAATGGQWWPVHRGTASQACPGRVSTVKGAAWLVTDEASRQSGSHDLVLSHRSWRAAPPSSNHAMITSR